MATRWTVAPCGVEVDGVHNGLMPRLGDMSRGADAPTAALPYWVLCRPWGISDEFLPEV